MSGQGHGTWFAPDGRNPSIQRSAPNGPEGTWHGTLPLHTWDPAPADGSPVVYVLLGQAPADTYVGSTQHFRSRVKRHLAAGKQVDRWMAYPARTRSAAYEIEARLIATYRPEANRKVGR